MALGPHRLFHNMTEVTDIQDILDKITFMFCSQNCVMDYHFCYKNRGVRTIFNVVRNTSGCNIRIKDITGPSVVFETNWSSEIDVKAKKWYEREFQYRAKTFMGHCAVGIPNVRKINVFNYGYEIWSEMGIDLVCIQTHCLRDRGIGALSFVVGQTNWTLPTMRDDVDTSLLFCWDMPGEDDFEKYIANIQKGHVAEIPKVGQVKRNLDLTSLDDE